MKDEEVRGNVFSIPRRPMILLVAERACAAIKASEPLSARFPGYEPDTAFDHSLGSVGANRSHAKPGTTKFVRNFASFV